MELVWFGPLEADVLTFPHRLIESSYRVNELLGVLCPSVG